MLLAVTVALALPQSVLAAPDRPTGLTATALDHDTVSLTWSHPDEENVDHYRVLRRSSGEGRLSQIATTQTTSFQDDGLQPETTYIYRVQAVDSEGARGRRSVKSETTTAAAPTITQVDPTPEPTPEHAQGQQGQNATPRSSHGIEVDICNRTPEIETAILQIVWITDSTATCSTVTSEQLAAIDGKLYIIGYSNPTLLKSDFEGLSGITEIEISQSPMLRTVPADAFDEFNKSGIFNLFLRNSGIKTLEAGAFDGFSSLEVLLLQSNQIKALEEGTFDGLTALAELHVPENLLTDLPAGIFDDLSNLQILSLYNNRLSTLPDGVFDNVSSLTNIDLSPNPPKDTDGRREDRRRGMRELQGRWPGLDWGRWEVGGGS